MGKVLGKYSWLYAMVCAFVVVGAHADPAIILNVSNNSDVASLINPGVEYQVWVGNTTETVNWNDLVSKTSEAAKFTFENAQIEMTNIVSANNVRIDGALYVYADNVPNADTLLFSNVSGMGVVYLIDENTNALYVTETYRDAGNSIFVHKARTTDYDLVLHNKAGRFLNKLRQDSPNDKLLRQLDSAHTMGELKGVMSKSFRLHPIKLMRPLKTLYSHKMLESVHIDDDDNVFVSANTVFGQDMFLYGGGINGNIKILDNLSMKLSGYVMDLKYYDDLEDYRGTMFGIGTDFIYDMATSGFVRVYGDFNLSAFDTGMVFDGHCATKNPNGFSGYAVGEYGYRFNWNKEYFVSPFVMMGADWATILDFDDATFYAGIGTDAGFSFEFDGLRYEHALRGMVRSDGGIGAGLNMSVWSIMDGAGADIGAGAFWDNDIGISYNLSFNVKIGF